MGNKKILFKIRDWWEKEDIIKCKQGSVKEYYKGGL